MLLAFRSVPAVSAILLGIAVCSTSAVAAVLDIGGNPLDPFARPVRARVFIFVRTDCPVTNRYAPELDRLAHEFDHQNVQFWLVYSDPAENAETIRHHLTEFHFPGTPLRDPQHRLVQRAHATVAPEAAVFDSSGRLIYHGRIDDRWVDFGKARPFAQTHDLENAISAVLAGKSIAQPETRAIGCSLADVAPQ